MKLTVIAVTALVPLVAGFQPATPNARPSTALNDWVAGRGSKAKNSFSPKVETMSSLDQQTYRRIGGHATLPGPSMPPRDPGPTNGFFAQPDTERGHDFAKPPPRMPVLTKNPNYAGSKYAHLPGSDYAPDQKPEEWHRL